MKKAELLEIKELLDLKCEQYNNANFIERDPIWIPHQFNKKEDIEIAGFLAATISWGNRASILKNAKQLVDWMEMQPHEFITNCSNKDLKPFRKFVHRTFNGEDCVFFLKSLKHIYLQYGGLESAFAVNSQQKMAGLQTNILTFRNRFLETPHPSRTTKHISDPSKKSTAKRLCMFLRWMARKDKKGVDFGIWSEIDPSQLCLPLDVHTGKVSRELNLLKRKQNDWQAVEEITSALREFDPKDPIKYDFALFGMGESGEL